MGAGLFLILVAVFMVVSHGIAPRLIHSIDHMDADFLQTRAFRVMVRLAAVLLLMLAFLERWTIFAMLASTPCFFALGLVFRRGLRGSRPQRRLTRPIPPPSPASRFTWRADGLGLAIAFLRFVVFIALLYWLMQ